MTPKRILVVDDEETIVGLCLRVLKKEGYEVVGASCGKEAVGIASSGNFHMAVMDMLMPGLDGLKTFLALREKRPDLIGVMITGHGTLDTAIQAMERGLSGFIRKPFVPFELVHVVREAFRRAALEEENIRLKTLIPLYELTERFLLSRSKEEILDEMIEALSRQTGAQRLSVLLHDDKEDVLRMVAAKGIRSEILSEIRIKPGERIAGRVFQEGKPLILNGGPEDNPRFRSYLMSKDIIAAISFPLKARDRTLGVLNITKVGKGSPFSEADIEMVSIICRQAMMALENLRIMDEKAERTRTRALLEQYLSPEVAEMLLSSGENLLEVGEIAEITILFADIRDFTPLVRQIPLIMLRSFLNDFFGLISEAIFKFKGTLDKFMGDAVLAFFGAPIRIGEPVSAAVDSALLMHEAFEEIKRRWMDKNQALSRIGLGIGISSGKVFLGNVGTKRRFDYTVIGADVNIAQRLASEAVYGEILISQEVADQLAPRFGIIRESRRLLKGLEKPVAVFSIARNAT